MRRTYFRSLPVRASSDHVTSGSTPQIRLCPYPYTTLLKPPNNCLHKIIIHLYVWGWQYSANIVFYILRREAIVVSFLFHRLLLSFFLKYQNRKKKIYDFSLSCLRFFYFNRLKLRMHNSWYLCQRTFKKFNRHDMFVFHQNVTGKIGKILLFISIVCPAATNTLRKRKSVKIKIK
jgi:hypothetical protein